MKQSSARSSLNSWSSARSDRRRRAPFKTTESASISNRNTPSQAISWPPSRRAGGVAEGRPELTELRQSFDLTRNLPDRKQKNAKGIFAGVAFKAPASDRSPLGIRAGLFRKGKRAVLTNFASARTKAPIATRLNADPTLIRRTPSAASSVTENGAPFKPIRTLTGLVTAAHTVRMCSALVSLARAARPLPPPRTLADGGSYRPSPGVRANSFRLAQPARMGMAGRGPIRRRPPCVLDSILETVYRPFGIARRVFDGPPTSPATSPARRIVSAAASGVWP